MMIFIGFVIFIFIFFAVTSGSGNSSSPSLSSKAKPRHQSGSPKTDKKPRTPPLKVLGSKEVISSPGNRQWLVDYKIISEDYILNFDRHDIDNIRFLAEYVRRVFDQGAETLEKDSVTSKIIRHIVLNNALLYKSINQCYEINTRQKAYEQVTKLIKEEQDISDPGEIKCDIKNYGVNPPRKKGKKLYAAEARHFADNNIQIKITYSDRYDSQTERIVDVYCSASHDYVAGFCHLRNEDRAFLIPKISSWETAGSFLVDKKIQETCRKKLLLI